MGIILGCITRLGEVDGVGVVAVEEGSDAEEGVER